MSEIPARPSAVRTARPTPSARRRGWLAGAAAVTVALGLGLRRGLRGVTGAAAWTGPLGDGLYAVLAYLLIAVLAPRVRSRAVAATAFGICAAVELFQLTGVPAALGQAFPPARLVLGTGFAATDLPLYLAGVVVAGAADAALRRRRRGPQ